MAQTDAKTWIPEIQGSVEKGAAIMSDGMSSYNSLARLGYKHGAVLHSEGVYVTGENIHTNSVEGFWSQLKRSIDGSYHHVTTHYLQKYVNEYSFRYSHRNDERNMFWTMMDRVIAQAS